MKKILFCFALLIQVVGFAQELGNSVNGSIKLLRANTIPSSSARYFTTDLGKEGFWYYDAADVTSADNTGTILVSSNGKRFKRIYSGQVDIKWFGAKGDGVTDDLAALNLAVQKAPYGRKLFFPPGNYIISNTWAIAGQFTIEGAGESTSQVSKITPSATFPVTSDLITITGGYSVVKNIRSDMNRKGKNWLTFIGSGSTNTVQGCYVTGVSANNWAIELRNGGAIQGIALMNIERNTFYDFDGGGIWANGGGDANTITRNFFQLLNSSSYLIKWDGVEGAANLVIANNTMTGSSKGVLINKALQPKFTFNQYEQLTINTNSDLAMIVIKGISWGGTISNNNLNTNYPNAGVAISFDSARHWTVINNTISGSDLSTTSIKTTKLTRDITFIPGETHGVLNDPTGGVATLHPWGTSKLRDLNLVGANPNNPGLTYGTSNAVSFLNIDAPNVSTQPATVRLFRQTNTRGESNFSIHRGNGSGD